MECDILRFSKRVDNFLFDSIKSQEYPTTPLFLETAANKPKALASVRQEISVMGSWSQAPGTEPRIGIDIGGATWWHFIFLGVFEV